MENENFIETLSRLSSLSVEEVQQRLIKAQLATNKPDIVKMDVPLFIRLLEFAREDAKDDIILHVIADNLVNLCSKGNVASMHDYKQLLKS